MRECKLCARALRGVLGELVGTKLPGATPIRVGALRPHKSLLEAIEARLLDDALSVGAVGMLAVNDLLTSPDSCLFTDVDDVGSSLQAVLDQLEVR